MFKISVVISNATENNATMAVLQWHKWQASVCGLVEPAGYIPAASSPRSCQPPVFHWAREEILVLALAYRRSRGPPVNGALSRWGWSEAI